MSRESIWKTCSLKNIEFEKFLSGVSEKIIIRNKVYTQKEFKKILDIQVPNNIILLKIYPDPHSVILVKNKYLDSGFSIFDANGYVSGPRDIPFVDIDNIPFYIKSKDLTYEYFDEVSPQRPLNRGENSVNPGYCGIFGIMFMIYFKNTSDIDDWNIQWLEFINTIREPFQKNKYSDSIALIIASEIQLIIKNTTNFFTIELHIIEKIKQYFNKLNIKYPQKKRKKQ